MAKVSMVQRDLKRRKLYSKYKAKRENLLSKSKDPDQSGRRRGHRHIPCSGRHVAGGARRRLLLAVCAQGACRMARGSQRAGGERPDLQSVAHLGRRELMYSNNSVLVRN